jgi:hypothetical protein
MGYLKYSDTIMPGAGGSPNPIVGTARYGRVHSVAAKFAYGTFNTSALLAGIYIPAGSVVIGSLVSIDTAFTGTSGDKFGLKLGSTGGTALIADTVTTLANLSDDAVLGNFTAFAKAKTDQQIYMTFAGTAFTAGSATVTIFFVPNDRT